jgi:hypothetical protein
MAVDLDALKWFHASTLTEEADKRQLLKWFVERVRSGKPVNVEVMKFIAAGVEQHLAGKKPWGAKRGIKKKDAFKTMEIAFPVYVAFRRIRRGDLAYAYTTVAEDFRVSEDTVKRYIAVVEEARRALQEFEINEGTTPRGDTDTTATGKRFYEAQSLYRILASPEGQAWLESPQGKGWLESLT